MLLFSIGMTIAGVPDRRIDLAAPTMVGAAVTIFQDDPIAIDNV
jgi:hypothetical protein